MDMSAKTPKAHTSMGMPKFDNTDVMNSLMFNTPEVQLDLPEPKKPDQLDKKSDFLRHMVMRRDKKQEILKKN